METTLDLTKILKQGDKVYSVVHGADITITSITDAHNFPIKTNRDNYTKRGSWYAEGIGECLLFPSKDNRDWSTYQRELVEGEIYFDAATNSIFIHKKYKNFNFKATYLCGVALKYPNILDLHDMVDSSANVVLANSEQRQQLLDLIDKEGYVYNAETVELDKKPHEFKPFDKVLVRDNESDKWRTNFFSHYADTGDVVCVSCSWDFVILYEGNEHLMGTTDSPK